MKLDAMYKGFCRLALFAVLLPSGVNGQFDDGKQVFNVRASYFGQPGALGNDTGNDGPAIQRAIDAAAAAGGGIVFFPAGRYRLASGVTIGNAITLKGAGWNRNATTPLGSWLHVTATTFVPVTMAGDGSSISSIAFLHDQPVPGPGWSPLPYPFTIELSGAVYGASLTDIMLLNPTKGIRQKATGGEAGGALYLDHIVGQPLLRGLEIEFTADVMYVNNVHFGPVWSTDLNVFNYTRGNAAGIVSYRNDHPNFQNIFLFEYLHGFLFDNNQHGVTTQFKISNYECDLCWEGMRVWGDGITGSVSNMDVHNGGYVGSVGINVLEAHSVLISVSNLRVTDSGAAIVYLHRGGVVGGVNPKILLDNVVANGWDYMNTGWKAFVADVGTSMTLGFNREFTNKHNNGQYWTAQVSPDM